MMFIHLSQFKEVKEPGLVDFRSILLWYLMLFKTFFNLGYKCQS